MEDTFRLVVTAIIKNKDGKVLITKRTADKKRWPNRWTVPGGNVSLGDRVGEPSKYNQIYYNILESALEREVKEETGLIIKNIKYLCSISVIDSVIMSMTAFYEGKDSDVSLQKEECDDYAWVSYEESKNYDLIEEIREQIGWHLQ